MGVVSKSQIRIYPEEYYTAIHRMVRMLDSLREMNQHVCVCVCAWEHMSCCGVRSTSDCTSFVASSGLVHRGSLAASHICRANRHHLLAHVFAYIPLDNIL